MLLESKNISSEASQFIKNMVNESFLLPVTTKACHINHSSKVVFNHLNVEDCGEGSLRCFELSFTNGRAKQMRNNPPSLFPPGENKAWQNVFSTTSPRRRLFLHCAFRQTYPYFFTRGIEGNCKRFRYLYTNQDYQTCRTRHREKQILWLDDNLRLSCRSKPIRLNSFFEEREPKWICKP